MSRSLCWKRLLLFNGLVTLTLGMSCQQKVAFDMLLDVEPQMDPRIAVQANNDFAFDLYTQLAKENDGGNLFFSPYSVFVALAMTAEGARYETAAEMGSVLRFPDETARIGDEAREIPWENSLIHAGIAELDRRLVRERDQAKTAAIEAQIEKLRAQLAAAGAKIQRLSKNDDRPDALSAARLREKEITNNLNQLADFVDKYEIRVANALWCEQTYPFDPEYVTTINRYYRTGGTFSVDFRYAFEEARVRINNWVEKQTKDRISDIIPAKALDKHTRLVLTNAIYFKGKWSTPFEEEQTEDRDFTLADGTKLLTPIMRAPKLKEARYAAFNADGSHFDTPIRTADFDTFSEGQQEPKPLYPDADGFAIVELPYKGGDLKMVLIAPNSPAGLPAIEQQLTSKSLGTWIGHLKNRETNVYLPKLKLETKYTLGDSKALSTLTEMGMVRAFTVPRSPEKGAQFYGMTTSTDPGEQLYISRVLHKAFIEVDEKGTEAAAATAVVMPQFLSARRDTSFSPEFKADRPFLFLIRDAQTGSVLFLGRMTSPATGGGTTSSVPSVP